MDPTLKRSLIEIQAPVEGRDATTNESRRSWIRFREIFVSIEPRRGKERFVAGSQESEVTHTIRGHHYDGIGVNATMRFIHEERVFYITAVMLDDDTHCELMMTARETDENPDG